MPAPPFTPDDRGETDLEFFTARPDLNVRVRLPRDDDGFPPGVLDPDLVAFVHVQIERDPVTNEPGTRARAIFYADSEEGNA